MSPADWLASRSVPVWAGWSAVGSAVSVPEKGHNWRKDCSAGCFKCGLCAKKCPKEAIDISGGIPKIDYEKCISCKLCVKACPDQVIVMLQDIIKSILHIN